MNQSIYIKKLSSSDKPPIDSGRGEGVNNISFGQLNFATAQVAKRPIEYFNNQENINTETIIGKNSKKPITIKGPAVVAAMSFGALSKQAKLAIAKGATLAETIDNTGEGGMLKEQREYADLLIAQYSTGRFGVDEKYLQKADAIEIKFGQGAKPGQGGLLPGYKNTPEIAETRSSAEKHIEPGISVHSPVAHPDIHTTEELKNKIEELRKITGGKPIILKIAACNLDQDLPLAIEANPDVISIDGSTGGTGAAPAVMLHNTGMPTAAALAEARAIMDKLNAPQELWIGGGINTGADMAKAIALGADLLFVGTAIMQALGCVKCGMCHEAKCAFGVCTQKPALTEKLDIKEGAQKVANFFKSTREEVKMLAAACGYDNIYDLKKTDLIPLTVEMATITGLPLYGVKNK